MPGQPHSSITAVHESDGVSERRAMSVEQFSGPLPPPAILKGYEDILPGAADRIVRMAEKQSEHRQVLEKKVISVETFKSKVGLFLAFIICLYFMWIGYQLIIHDKKITGFILALTPLGGIIGMFIVQKNKDTKKEKEPSSKEGV